MAVAGQASTPATVTVTLPAPPPLPKDSEGAEWIYRVTATGTPLPPPRDPPLRTTTSPPGGTTSPRASPPQLAGCGSPAEPADPGPGARLQPPRLLSLAGPQGDPGRPPSCPRGDCYLHRPILGTYNGIRFIYQTTARSGPGDPAKSQAGWSRSRLPENWEQAKQHWIATRRVSGSWPTPVEYPAFVYYAAMAALPNAQEAVLSDTVTLYNPALTWIETRAVDGRGEATGREAPRRPAPDAGQRHGQRHERADPLGPLRHRGHLPLRRRRRARRNLRQSPLRLRRRRTPPRPHRRPVVRAAGPQPGAARCRRLPPQPYRRPHLTLPPCPAHSPPPSAPPNPREISRPLAILFVRIHNYFHTATAALSSGLPVTFRACLAIPIGGTFIGYQPR